MMRLPSMKPNGPLKPSALPPFLAWSIFCHIACLDCQSSWVRSSAKRIPSSLHTGEALNDDLSVLVLRGSPHSVYNIDRFVHLRLQVRSNSAQSLHHFCSDIIIYFHFFPFDAKAPSAFCVFLDLISSL